MTLLSLITIAHPLLADISDGISTAGGGLVSAGGGFGDMLKDIALSARPLFFILGVVMISFAGLRQVIGQEDSTDKLKSSIILVVSGMILAFMVDPFIEAFYGGVSAEPISTAILTLVDGVLGIAMPIALLSIIIGAVLGLTNATSEEGISKMRAAMTASIAGLLVLALRVAIALLAENYDASPFKSALAGVMNTVLGWVGVLAILSLIIAGLYYIISWGREDQATKGKSLVFRVITGIAIILLAVTVIQTIVHLTGAG